MKFQGKLVRKFIGRCVNSEIVKKCIESYENVVKMTKLNWAKKNLFVDYRKCKFHENFE